MFIIIIRELKQTRRRRKQLRHLKMKLCVSAVIFQLFKIITLENCVLTILELNWNQRLGYKKTKLNICHHMLTSSTQLQNWSVHVVERTRTSTKCEKNEICTCKACKNTIFHCQICKFAGFLLPSSPWLLKLPNNWEFEIYDATVAKTSLKIARSSLSIFFAIISVCVTFES